MNKEEIFEYLKDNLKIETEIYKDCMANGKSTLKIELKLEDEVISSNEKQLT